METKQLISWLRDKADRAHDQSWTRMMHKAADRLKELDTHNAALESERQAWLVDQQKQMWIPVTERLPEDRNDRVLVITNEKYPYCPVGNQPIDTDRYRGKYGKWVRYGDKVTHWMPLPEPPKEVDHES